MREAIANTLPHRDHTTDTAVEVNVYMDFVERDEPGLFPEGGAPETIWQRQTAASSSATRASRRRSSARE